MSTIGDIAIRIVADPRDAVSGLQRFSGEVEKVAGSVESQSQRMRNFGKAMTSMAAGGLAAIVGLSVKSMATYKDYGSTVNKLTGLMNTSTEQASMLAGQWKRFGIDGATGATAVKLLSKQIEAARGGNEAASAAFARLGVSMEDLQSKGAADVMMQVRDAMSQMDDKTERTAMMLQLFGRSGTEMLGWVKQAPGDIANVNKSLEKLGLVWGDKQIKNWRDLAKAQAENKLVWEGFQMQLAQSLVPTLTGVLQMFQQVLWVIQPLAPVLKYVAAGLAAFLIAGKLAQTASAIMAFAQAARVAAAAQWLLNVAMSANPVVLIIVGIIALIATFVALWRKCAWFREFWIGLWDGIKAVFWGVVGFIRDNWRRMVIALAGPFAPVVALILGHFDEIKRAAKIVGRVLADAFWAAAHAIVRAFNWLKGQSFTIWNEMKKIPVLGRVLDITQNAAAGVWNYMTGDQASFAQNVGNLQRSLPSFAGGGLASGPQSGYLAVLHGDEVVTPLDKAAPSVVVNVTGNTFVGNSRDAAQAITDMVEPELARRVDRATRGGALLYG